MSRPDGRLAGGRAGLATLRQSELVESSPAVETQLISPTKTQTDGGWSSRTATAVTDTGRTGATSTTTGTTRRFSTAGWATSLSRWVQWGGLGSPNSWCCLQENAIKWWVTVNGLNHHEVSQAASEVSPATNCLNNWTFPDQTPLREGLRPAGEPRRQGEGRGVQHPFLAGPQRSGEDGVQGGDLQQYDHRLREARHQGLHLDPPQVQGRVGRQLQIIVNSLNLSLVEQSQITNKRKKGKVFLLFWFS